jgi:hypothetical protein
MTGLGMWAYVTEETMSMARNHPEEYGIGGQHVQKHLLQRLPMWQQVRFATRMLSMAWFMYSAFTH